MEVINKGYKQGQFIFYLRKAFDLVDHEIIIDKLKAYKFSNSATARFASYLNDRRQCLNQMYQIIIYQHSERSLQGSTLDPLLFLLYINDFELCLRHCKADTSADDCTFQVAGINLTETKIS